jgi:hypothetical protein
MEDEKQQENQEDQDQDQDGSESVGAKGARKRTKARSGKTKRAAKKRKVEEDDEVSTGGEEEDRDKMDAIPDRPLGVRLRARKGRKVAAVIDSDGDSE